VTQQPGHTILEHPSDIGIEATGATLAEAFEQAASGMMEIILDTAFVQSVQSRTINLHADDYEQLLVKWLTEILYLYDGQQFVSGSFQITILKNTMLTATIRGEVFHPDRHRTRLDVKAVTYHQMTIEEHLPGARVRVFLDI